MASRELLKSSNVHTSTIHPFGNSSSAIQSGMHGLSFVLEAVRHASDDARRNQADAGLSVLRLVDGALKSNRVDDLREAKAKEAVEQVVNFAIRRTLRGVIVALRAPANRRSLWRRRVGTAFLEYAAELRTLGDYALAEEVYHLLARRLTDEPRIHMQALVGRAWALHRARLHDAAEEVYRELKEVARRNKVLDMELDADLGLAGLASRRGDIEAMRVGILRVLDIAMKSGERRIEGRAYAYLAWIAGNTDAPHDVIRYSSAAIATGLSSIDETRCWINMANAFRATDRIDTASEIARILVATGNSTEERVEGMLLLYEVAIDRRDRDGVASCRAFLAGTPRTPGQDAEFTQHRARERFVMHEDRDGAIDELARALSFAETHDLIEMRKRASDTLSLLREGATPPIFAPPTSNATKDTESDIADIVELIHDRYSASVAVA